MIIVFFLFISTLLSSAQLNVDSVLTDIYRKPDTIQIKILNFLCLKLRGTDPQTALKFGRIALKKAEQCGDKRLQAEAINLIGVVRRNSGNLSEAMLNSVQALKLAQEINDLTEIAYSYNNISAVYRESGNNPSALEYAIKALDIFEHKQDYVGIAFCELNIGVIYSNQNNFAKALEHLHRSLNIRKKQKDTMEVIHSLDNIAYVYFNMKDYDRSLKTYLELEKSEIILGDKRGLGVTWNGISQIYFLRNDFSFSLEYRLKSYQVFNELKYYDDFVNACGNIGLTYAKLNNLPQGRHYINEGLSNLFHVKSLKTKCDFYYQCAEFFEMSNVKDSAIYYYKLHAQLQDTIHYSDNLYKFSEIEALYQNEKIVRENQMLVKNVESQNRQTVYLILIITLTTIILLGTLYRFASVKSTNTKLNQLNGMKDAFFRIIAHDLKAPFNAIFGYANILKSDYHELSDDERLSFIDNIGGAVNKSYQLLEQLLLWSRSNSGNLEFNPTQFNLYSLIKDTVQLLEPTASQKSIALEFSCDENLVLKADKEMINTVVRNLTSNGIKFTKENGTVEIIASEETNSISISVKDSGIGMTEAQSKNLFRIDKSTSTKGTKGEQGTGLGLIICKEFVDKHKGKISVHTKLGEGTKFIVILPKA
jgi:signal transduction histidine kinase